MTYEAIQKHAIEFLLNFTKSDVINPVDYNAFKAYRSMHKKGTLKKGSYERVLDYLGYTKIERWDEPKPVSDKLIDILT